jgi:hypothetical protein
LFGFCRPNPKRGSALLSYLKRLTIALLSLTRRAKALLFPFGRRPIGLPATTVFVADKSNFSGELVRRLNRASIHLKCRRLRTSKAQDYRGTENYSACHQHANLTEIGRYSSTIKKPGLC